MEDDDRDTGSAAGLDIGSDRESGKGGESGTPVITNPGTLALLPALTEREAFQELTNAAREHVLALNKEFNISKELTPEELIELTIVLRSSGMRSHIKFSTASEGEEYDQRNEFEIMRTQDIRTFCRIFGIDKSADRQKLKEIFDEITDAIKAFELECFPRI